MLFMPSCASHGGGSRPTIQVTGPVVVGFFPPVTDSEIENEPGTREGIAHLQFALSDVARCLQGLPVTVRLELTRVLVFESGGKRTVARIPGDWPQAVGAYLVRPGAAPEVVYAQAGPSSLGILLPNAAAEYFGVPACRIEL
jgi:hypothetical protein